jgi:hypothetical protein
LVDDASGVSSACISARISALRMKRAVSRRARCRNEVEDAIVEHASDEVKAAAVAVAKTEAKAQAGAKAVTAAGAEAKARAAARAEAEAKAAQAELRTAIPTSGV